MVPDALLAALAPILGVVRGLEGVTARCEPAPARETPRRVSSRCRRSWRCWWPSSWSSSRSGSGLGVALKHSFVASLAASALGLGLKGRFRDRVFAPVVIHFRHDDRRVPYSLDRARRVGSCGANGTSLAAALRPAWHRCSDAGDASGRRTKEFSPDDPSLRREQSGRAKRPPDVPVAAVAEAVNVRAGFPLCQGSCRTFRETRRDERTNLGGEKRSTA